MLHFLIGLTPKGEKLLSYKQILPFKNRLFFLTMLQKLNSQKLFLFVKVVKNGCLPILFLQTVRNEQVIILILG